MIISEKQILELIMIARGYIDLLTEKGGIAKGAAEQVLSVIETIMSQQSQELKVIE
jgi:hypothetical protein